MNTGNTTLRADIRRLIRARRRQLTDAQRRADDDRINDHLTHSAAFRYADRLAGFMANDGEPDLSRARHHAWALRKRWHLPKIATAHAARLWFTPYAPGDRLTPNRFGIPEPDHAAKTATPPWAIQLLLMPLVAFDAAGNRLGMGKGYYDRTLSFLHHRRYWRKPLLIGVAYAFQEVERIPAQPWDIPLHGVVTAAGIRWFYPPSNPFNHQDANNP